MFRCTRTFPGSDTPSRILRALDCGCGRTFHRHVRPRCGCDSRRVLVAHQLGLHERHRELRAQFRCRTPSSSATRKTPTPTKRCPHHRRHRELRRRGQKDKHNCDVALGLYIQPSSNDQRKAEDTAAVCRKGGSATANGSTASGLQENDRFGVDFTKPLRCTAEPHRPWHGAPCEVANFGFRS